MIRRLFWAGLALQVCAAPGFAQTTPPGAPIAAPAPAGGIFKGGDTAGGFAAIAPPGDEPAQIVSEDHLSAGANSFTEKQARSRLKQNGYGQVSGLSKGDDGIWRGSAVKGGSTVHVAVDFKGNISVN
jgi:periplasmic protein CpxP/Spy